MHDQPAPQDDAVRYPGFWLLLTAWVVIGVLTSARYVLQPARPEPFALPMTLLWVACFLPWAVLSPVAFALERRFPLDADSWLLNLARLVGASVVVATVASPLMLGAAGLVAWAMGWPLGFLRIPWMWFSHVPAAALCFWCSVAVGYFIRTRHELRAHERRAARSALEKAHLEAGLNQAQLEVLRAKLNPHFLFNSLQNISVLTGQDPETASEMLTRLGDLLHAALRGDATPEVTVHEEIELARAYVALEQLRFGDRLRAAFDVAPDIAPALVPCFVLQPLLENAIVHGLRGVRRGGEITVVARREDASLLLSVSDNGVGLACADPAAVTLGVGLGSTRERLARLYPAAHTFAIDSGPAGGVEVRITLPLRRSRDATRAIPTTASA